MLKMINCPGRWLRIMMRTKFMQKNTNDNLLMMQRNKRKKMCLWRNFHTTHKSRRFSRRSGVRFQVGLLSVVLAYWFRWLNSKRSFEEKANKQLMNDSRCDVRQNKFPAPLANESESDLNGHRQQDLCASPILLINFHTFVRKQISNCAKKTFAIRETSQMAFVIISRENETGWRRIRSAPQKIIRIPHAKSFCPKSGCFMSCAIYIDPIKRSHFCASARLVMNCSLDLDLARPFLKRNFHLDVPMTLKRSLYQHLISAFRSHFTLVH